MHGECSRFALQTCPYLAMPHYTHRIDVANLEKLPPEARILIDQTVMPGRPELFVNVNGDRFEIQHNGPVALPYTRPVKPVAAYEYWRHGEQLTLDQALPILHGIFGAGWMPPATQEGK